MRAFAAALVALAALTGAQAQPIAPPERVTIGVGGRALLNFLALTIAERRGFFRAQGLDVEILDFAGGAKSLQALVGGSVDAVVGGFDHVVRMQAKGQDVRAVVALCRYPAVVVAARRGAGVETLADLRGRTIGVTAPGSFTHYVADLALAQAGLAPQDAAIVGIGGAASALAAVRRAQVDAVVHIEPVVTMLERSGDIRVLLDARDEAGARRLFGGENPAAVLYLRADAIERRPRVAQALVDAFLATLAWMRSAPVEAIADSAPEGDLLGDRALWTAAVSHLRGSWSPDGLIKPAQMATARDSLAKTDPDLAAARFDLAKTFDGRFVAASRTLTEAR